MVCGMVLRFCTRTRWIICYSKSVEVWSQFPVSRYMMVGMLVVDCLNEILGTGKESCSRTALMTETRVFWHMKFCFVVWIVYETSKDRFTFNILRVVHSKQVPGSSVSIATAYGLDGPRIESRWGQIFRTCPDRSWGPPSLLYNGVPGLSRG